MAVSPLLPRSPSNINANISAAKAKSLTVRNSAPSTSASASGKSAKPQQEFDLAEKMNEEIASKYVKGTTNSLILVI
jgi:hypothetical protein